MQHVDSEFTNVQHSHMIYQACHVNEIVFEAINNSVLFKILLHY